MNNLLTAEEKKKIYNDLFKITFEELKSERLSLETGQIVAEYILNNMNFIQKRQELEKFFENLSILWSFFTKYYLDFKKEELARQDKIKIEELSKKIFNFIH